MCNKMQWLTLLLLAGGSTGGGDSMHPALSAPHGGPLAVRFVSDNGQDGSQPAHELLFPHFSGIVSLSDEQSAGLRAGLRGTVFIDAKRESIAAHLYQSFANWIKNMVGKHVQGERSV